MHELAGKNVLVLGLGKSGVAASRLLRARGARVRVIDSADSNQLAAQAASLLAMGINVSLGATRLPGESFDLAVISPGVPPNLPVVMEVRARGIPIIGELELGYQQSGCRNISITGTNGKTTTTELVERMLKACQRKTIAAGNIGLPICEIVERTKELDLLTLEVSSFQLETIKDFRPSVAVLLNIAPDHLDRYQSIDEYLQAKARLFVNQQPSDWAIIQSEAMTQLLNAGVVLQSQIITFSAKDDGADLYLDGHLIVERLANGKRVWLDLNDCHLKGAHNAENLMAALAVGRILRLPRREMNAALQSYEPAPHRCELVGEIDGVRYVNDSKATNPHAVAYAIASMPNRPSGKRNVLLIAGGKEKGLPYGDLAPILVQRVKKAYLLGETRKTLLAAWRPFTPCALVGSLLEAVSSASQDAEAGDVVLLSPACSSFDMFRDYQHRGEDFRTAVQQLRKARIPEFAPGSTFAATPAGALHE